MSVHMVHETQVLPFCVTVRHSLIIQSKRLPRNPVAIAIPEFAFFCILYLSSIWRVLLSLFLLILISVLNTARSRPR